MVYTCLYNDIKSVKCILLYIHLTEKIEQGLLSSGGDGVEDRARKAIFLPGLGLPHDGKHARSGQGLEMRVGRNVDDRRAPIHGLAQDARHDLSVYRSGLGDGHLEQVNQDVPHGGPVLGQSPICGSLR